jgi:hypothetical protein
LPVILATQETESRRIEVQNQPGQIVLENLSQKYPSQKMGWWSAQVVGPEFKPLYHKKRKIQTTQRFMNQNENMDYIHEIEY